MALVHGGRSGHSLSVEHNFILRPLSAFTILGPFDAYCCIDAYILLHFLVRPPI